MGRAQSVDRERGRSVELTIDAFNVLNMINPQWGLVRRTTDFSSLNVHSATPLVLAGYDTSRDRGIYSVQPIERNRVDPDAGGWRLQLGARAAY
jgi:hypothetical protein